MKKMTTVFMAMCITGLAYSGDALVQLDLKQVKVGGEIGRRIDVTVTNNILRLNVDKDFLAPFQKREPKADYIGLGKLIDTVVRMAAYTADEKVVALKKHLVDEIIKAQEADGYIGDMVQEKRMWQLWDVHEMGYIIYSLINDYRYFGEKKSLDAARKAADYIVKRWPEMPADWGQKTSVGVHVGVTGIDRTMLALYKVLNDKKYLDFCLKDRAIQDWSVPIIVGRRKLIEGHTYAYMAMCLAQLELYRVQPDERLLKQALGAIDFMTARDGMVITGGVGQWEIWTDDQDGRGELSESCSTAYQLRVYDNLLCLKGDSRFGDLMERTIYNTLFAAQSPDGRQIRYFAPLEGARVYHNGDTYCCPCNYRRIVSELPLFVYYRFGKGFAVNIYAESQAKIEQEEGLSIMVRQETDYPNSGNVVISVEPSKQAAFPVKLRIPSWCKEAKITINGQQMDRSVSAGTFAVIDREWKAGDKITLDMPMKWRLVEGRKRQAGRVAVMRGPQVFTLNPEKNKSLANKDGADLGRMVINLAGIESEPLSSDAVRPRGVACRLKAGSSGFGMDNPGNILLTLTEFPDPNGKCTYFRVPDMKDAVPDELLGLWK